MSDEPPFRAFPSSAINDKYGGMSLRDWFAGKVVAGMMASEDIVVTDNSPSFAASFARVAYEVADAMMVARQPAPALDSETVRCAAMGISNIADGKCTTCGRVEADCDCLPF